MPGPPPPARSYQEELAQTDEILAALGAAERDIENALRVNGAGLAPDIANRAAEALRQINDLLSQRLLFQRFPESGDRARSLYPLHLEHFAAGARYRERCFMAANRIGKTEAGAFETALHLTGLYPEWWQGRRFDRPIEAWACGKTNADIRKIVQHKLLGGRTDDEDNPGSGTRIDGTGLIPGYLLGRTTMKTNLPGVVDSIRVRHVSGRWSTLGFQSYEQGRSAFEGTSRHLIWLDEEPPFDVYGECLIRTLDCDGIVILTFTPLQGVSDVVLQFLPHLRPTEN